MQPRSLRLVGVTIALAFLVALPLAAEPQRPRKAAGPSFEDSRIYFEYNSTDRDIGIQISADAEAWSSLKIFDPRGNKIFDVTGKGPTATLGLSELFVESDEPGLGDVSLADFLSLYPEGQYKFVGVTPDGETFTGKFRLSHILPAAPVITGPDEEPKDRNNVVVSWRPVPDPAGSKIVTYQVILESGDPSRTLQIDLPAGVTSVRLPPEYLQPGTEYGFEVIAWETGSNHTISIGSFTTK